MLKRLEFIVFPKGSNRRAKIKKALVKLNLRSPFVPDEYSIWIQQQQKCVARFNKYKDLPNNIKISVVVPVYNTPIQFLNEFVYSVLGQSYTNWELILVDASTDTNTIERTKTLEKSDERIRVVFVENKGISANTNVGLKIAKGDFVAFCDHDDTLDYDAFSAVIDKVVNEGAEIIYTDEDKISEDSRIYFDPFLKPNWSPDLLTHVNYLNHLTVVSIDIINKIGKLNPKYDGAQDFDYYLRATSSTNKISHVSGAMYHWRSTRNSTSQDFSSKTNILVSGERALNDYFINNKVNALANAKLGAPGFYNIQFRYKYPITLIFMPIYDELTEKMFIDRFLAKTKITPSDTEVILPVKLHSSKNNSYRTITDYQSEDDYLNKAIESSKNKHIIIINRFLIPRDIDWIEKITGHFGIDRISAVGPRIMRSSNIVDSCGMVKDYYGNYSHIFRSFVTGRKTNSIYGDVDWVRNVDAIGDGIVCARKSELEFFIKNNEYATKNIIYEFTKSTKGNKVMDATIVFDNYGVHDNNSDIADGVANNLTFVENGRFYLKSTQRTVINMLREIK